MGPIEYKAEREKRGTQKEVAALLGVSRVTIARRETGARPVIREAWLALLALPKKRARAKRPNTVGQATAKPLPAPDGSAVSEQL